MESQDARKHSSSSSSFHRAETTSSSKPRNRQFTTTDPYAVAGSLPVRSPNVLPHQNYTRSYNNNFRGNPVPSSFSSSSHRAETTSNPRHRQFTTTDPSAVAGSLPVRSPNVLPHQNYTSGYNNNFRGDLGFNGYNNNFRGDLGFNHQYHNHYVMNPSSFSQYELHNTNSYNSYVNNHVNQNFEWNVVRSDPQTFGNFDTNPQQYGRVDANQGRGRGRGRNFNSRGNYLHQSVTNRGNLQKPGVIDLLDRVKTPGTGKSSLNLHAGVDGSKQDHINTSLKSVLKGKGQQSHELPPVYSSRKLVSGQLDILGPVTKSNTHSVEARSIEEPLLNLHVNNDIITNKYISDQKDQMPAGNCGPSAMNFRASVQPGSVIKIVPHSVEGVNPPGEAFSNTQHGENVDIKNVQAYHKQDTGGSRDTDYKKRCHKPIDKVENDKIENMHTNDEKNYTPEGDCESDHMSLQAEVEKMAIEFGYFYYDNEMNSVHKYHDEMRSPEHCDKLEVSSQLNHPGPGLGVDPHSVKLTCTEGSSMNMHAENARTAKEYWNNKQHQMKDNPLSKNTNVKKKGQNFNDKVLVNKDNAGYSRANVKKKGQRSHPNKGFKESRKQYTKTMARGRILLSKDERKSMSQMICRGGIEMLTGLFLAKYESLIPADEEKSKQKQLFTLVKRLVYEQWPEAQLYLYGSCANSFAASTSDIDVCVSFGDAEIEKTNVLLRLAEILQSHNFQNVKALPRTRVPIVKFVDPLTGISCDLCVNNVLSVENTKLLRDYAGIDARLRQLVFIIKHWAKSRGVNETYEGTLSSYAYALMCIHFLQQRKPAILPCLQDMEITYSVTVDECQCAYFDRVEELRCFGSNNKENIAELVWAFFGYWAYCHDYENAVISVRTGSIISKQSKEWTSNLGKDRHFISIEDPFEISHDLGRVINRLTLKVMRVEFERAAYIMQFDPNPCVSLFEPYVADRPLSRVWP